MKNKKQNKLIGRKLRVRKRINGCAERPRLKVMRSLNNFSAQLIDDTVNKTIVSLSTADKDFKSKLSYGGNIKAAEAFGEIFIKKAKEKGISKVVFDRAGYLYHGRVKAFAEALRKGGLEF